MLKLSRFVLLIFVSESLFPASTAGQTFELKNDDERVVLTISAVTMFRQSAKKEEIPVFQGVVKNTSGERLTLEPIKGTVHKKDGSTVEFIFGLCSTRWCEFPAESTRDVSHAFPKETFTPANFDFIEFSEWQKSGPLRIAAQQASEKQAADAAPALARKKAAEAARREQVEEAEETAKEARLRSACKGIYGRTANKKVSDLTVKEEQQVRACQALGLYPPSR